MDCFQILANANNAAVNIGVMSGVAGNLFVLR